MQKRGDGGAGRKCGAALLTRCATSGGPLCAGLGAAWRPPGVDAGGTIPHGRVAFVTSGVTPLPSPSARLALALLALEGVGRVTAHRILERFPTLDAVRATPREQVLLRLKGAPHAERTVDRLFSDDWSAEALAAADAQLVSHAARGLHVLAPGAAEWPPGLDSLDRAARPVLLLAYGNLQTLRRPLVAFLGQPPLAPDAFETAQSLARQVLSRRGGLAVGLAHGFDLALAKVSEGAAVAVAPCGLARLTPSLRPGATLLVRAGGVLVSSFDMEHGPFEHDAREAALVQAALARAVVAVGAVSGTAVGKAAAWAAEAGRPLVGLPPVDPALASVSVSPSDALGVL